MAVRLPGIFFGGMRLLRFSSAVIAALFLIARPAFSGSFNITSNSTTAQTLGTSSGQTGSVSSGVSLAVSGGTVAVTISGNNATLNNDGTINQTGTGRVIRDNTGVTGLVVNNGSATNSAAIMQSADADVIQMAKSPASVTLNNYGTMTSLNGSRPRPATAASRAEVPELTVCARPPPR